MFTDPCALFTNTLYFLQITLLIISDLFVYIRYPVYQHSSSCLGHAFSVVLVDSNFNPLQWPRKPWNDLYVVEECINFCLFVCSPILSGGSNRWVRVTCKAARVYHVISVNYKSLFFHGLATPNQSISMLFWPDCAVVIWF